MQITRRRFCRNTVEGGLALGVVHAGGGFILSKQAPANRATYLNPVLGGDHPDAGAIRVGDDFFLTHSSFDYAPGLPIVMDGGKRGQIVKVCADLSCRVHHPDTPSPQQVERQRADERSRRATC